MRQKCKGTQQQLRAAIRSGRESKNHEKRDKKKKKKKLDDAKKRDRAAGNEFSI